LRGNFELVTASAVSPLLYIPVAITDKMTAQDIRKKPKVEQLIKMVREIIDYAKAEERSHQAEIEAVHPVYSSSAKNLLHYRALRQHDIRYLQKNLRNRGLSGLAKVERHVMARMHYTLAYLNALNGESLEVPGYFELSIKEGSKKLNRHSKALLGKRTPGRRVRIMVTLPSSAANDTQLVEGLVQQGMNMARINCAHDHEQVWLKMIEQIKEAAHKFKKRVKICMDLAGPKIRTGSIKPGPPVIRLKPPKTPLGAIAEPLRFQLVPCDKYTGLENPLAVPIPAEALKLLTPQTRIAFRDARGKKRNIYIEIIDKQGAWATAEATTYLTNGIHFQIKERSFEFTGIRNVPGYLQLMQGETLVLHARERPGESALYDETGHQLAPAHICCTNKEIFKDVKAGEPVYFDDGKISGTIKKTSPAEMEIKITSGGDQPQKLGSDKGINFPESELSISGLTDKDRQDLKFVCQHADVVNFSFVNCAQDVEDLLQVLDSNGVKDKIGIILKIETRRGFLNLVSILLTAMQSYPIGVMIARGDLAIEGGWEHLGSLQEEILRICEAAHIPDIWATQVLENLAKKGLPSRAEITDASMGQRAECIMLNKGPHILEAIKMLDGILKNMRSYLDKKDVILPILVQSPDLGLTPKSETESNKQPEQSTVK